MTDCFGVHAWAKCYCGGGENALLYGCCSYKNSNFCWIGKWQAPKCRWLAVRQIPMEAREHDVEQEERRQYSGKGGQDGGGSGQVGAQGKSFLLWLVTYLILEDVYFEALIKVQ